MKLANKAALWYVPCSLQNVEKIMEVPPIKVECVENFAGFSFSLLSYFVFLPVALWSVFSWFGCLKEGKRQDDSIFFVIQLMCLQTPVHVLMCVLCVVCKCRAGGGGQETLWSPEEGTAGDQSQNWRDGGASSCPRYRSLKLMVLAVTLVLKCWRCLRSIASFAFQSSTQLASASLVSSIWWALWTAHYTTTLMEVSLCLCLFPLFMLL